jgi:hypothetical protein
MRILYYYNEELLKENDWQPSFSYDTSSTQPNLSPALDILGGYVTPALDPNIVYATVSIDMYLRNN